MGGGENDSEASHDWAGGQLRQGPPPIAVTRRISYEGWRREWLQGQPRLGGGQLRQGPLPIAATLSMAANTTMGGGENDSKASDDWAEGSFGKALQLIAVTHCKEGRLEGGG